MAENQDKSEQPRPEGYVGKRRDNKPYEGTHRWTKDKKD